MPQGDMSKITKFQCKNTVKATKGLICSGTMSWKKLYAVKFLKSGQQFLI